MIQEGMELNGYRIIEKIGEGGMGTVYKSYDLNLERYVALKAIHNYLTSSVDIVARFKQEARIQASLIHPNIISLFNLFQYDGLYFMVMEYVDGETLSKRIKRVGLLPPHKCIPMFVQILQAVDFAHQRGIVHRDLKPSNIMILKDDSIKVMDFGIAKIVGDRSLTKTGTKMGTIYYSSPEQIKGEKNIDHRSDIYSLGITFFEMLTGHLPYNISTESDYVIMQQIVEVKIPSVRKYYPYVPDKVDIAVQKATMKNPDERFQNCQEFIDFIKFEKIDEQENLVKKEINSPPIESKGNLINDGTKNQNKINIQSSEKEKNAFRKEITNPPIDSDERYINKGIQGQKKIKFYYHDYESISFKDVKAKPSKRIIAFILDTIIFVLFNLFLFVTLEDKVLSLIFIIFLAIFIYFPKDILGEGKGIAKGWFKLRLINTRKNSPISFTQALLRNLLSYLFWNIYGIGFIIDVILIFADQRGRRIADFILGTQVVDDELYTKMFLNQSK